MYGLAYLAFAAFTFGIIGMGYALLDPEVMGPELPFELLATIGAIGLSAIFWRYGFDNPIDTWMARVLLSVTATVLLVISVFDVAALIRSSPAD